MLSLVLVHHKSAMQWFIVAILLSSLAVTHATYGLYYQRYNRCWPWWRCYRAPTALKCGTDSDCGSSSYCDQNWKYCKECKALNGQCRRDENCCQGRVCECGCCQEPKKPGSEGAQCRSDVDCNEGMCCARDTRCGVTSRFICKKLSKLGESCSEADGLGYKNQYKCPCDKGLRCQENQVRRAYRFGHIYWYYRHHACVLNATNATGAPTTEEIMSGLGAPITDEPNTVVIEVPNTTEPPPPNTTEPPQPVPLEDEASDVATAEKKRGKVGKGGKSKTKKPKPKKAKDKKGNGKRE